MFNIDGITVNQAVEFYQSLTPAEQKAMDNLGREITQREAKRKADYQGQVFSSLNKFLEQRYNQ